MPPGCARRTLSQKVVSSTTVRILHTIVPTKMSGSNQTTDTSTSNFPAIFEAASHEYRTLTREDLETHPFASTLEGYNSPDLILDVFRKQAKAFDKFRKGDDKLIVILSPIVNILFTFSETLREGVGDSRSSKQLFLLDIAAFITCIL